MYRIITKSGSEYLCYYWTWVYAKRDDGSDCVEILYLLNEKDQECHRIDFNDLDTIMEVIA